MGNNIKIAFIATAWEGLDWIYLDQDKGHILCCLEYANETLGSTGWVELLNWLMNSRLIKESDPWIYLLR